MPSSSSSPTAVTLDAPSSPGIGGSADNSPSHDSNRRGRVAMVAGSTPQLSGELHSLLRSRLRMSAILLAIGFAAFFVRNLFYLDLADTFDLVLLGMHGLVTVVLGIIGFGLCHRHEYCNRTLRGTEFLVFGLPAAFFILMQWESMTTCHQTTSSTAYLASPTSPWLLLMFNYSMLIPNVWRRAAVKLGIMAALPTGMFLVAWLMHDRMYNSLSFLEVSQVGMILALGAATGTYGVYSMGRLRQEAFEAKQLGQYRLKRQLGAGGMGEVYLAEHQLMKRPVAIKLIKPGKAADPQALARFEREVRATAKLSHWNTVEIFDYGRTDDGTFYYVMEYLPGMSLADLVERHGPLVPERVVSLMMQVCEALGEAHSKCLIHRDIKPGNIFAATRGGVYDVAKLLDFGLAKPMMSRDDITLTQEGSITGSPLFMAPEQATSDGEPDARSDIYSLGGVMYYLLTGKPPFEADNPIKVLLAHARDEVTPPSRLQPGVPDDVEQIVLKCLEKDPEDRYADTDELLAALAATSAAGKWTRDHARQWWENNGTEEHHEARCEKVMAEEEAALAG